MIYVNREDRATLGVESIRELKQDIYVAPNDVLAPDWEIQLALGCSFAPSKTDWGSFAHFMIDEFFNWDIFSGKGGVWKRPYTARTTGTCSPLPCPK